MSGNLLDPNYSGPSSLSIADFCDQVTTNVDVYGHYWVVKIEHCKRKHGVEHEFLIVSVVNTESDSSLQTKVCVERGRGRADRWWYPLSSLGPAKDQISRWPLEAGGRTENATSDKTVKGAKLFGDRLVGDQDVRHISSLRVIDTNTFAIRDFCFILRVVIEMAPQYDLKDYQCYWFCIAVLALARKAFPDLLPVKGQDATRAGKWGEKKIQILDLDRAKRKLDELAEREEEEESNLEAVNETFKKANAASAPELLREARSKAVTTMVTMTRIHQQETKRGDEETVARAISRAREEAAWETGVEAMSPISKAFAKSSRNGEVEARPTKRGWNDRSWVMGPEWRPSSSNTPTPPKTMAFDSKW